MSLIFYRAFSLIFFLNIIYIKNPSFEPTPKHKDDAKTPTSQNPRYLCSQMPHPKAKALSSLFRSAVKARSKPSSSPADDATLKHFVSSLDTSSSEFPKISPKTSISSGTGSETTSHPGRGLLSHVDCNFLLDVRVE